MRWSDSEYREGLASCLQRLQLPLPPQECSSSKDIQEYCCVAVSPLFADRMSRKFDILPSISSFFCEASFPQFLGAIRPILADLCDPHVAFTKVGIFSFSATFLLPFDSLCGSLQVFAVLLGGFWLEGLDAILLYRRVEERVNDRTCEVSIDWRDLWNSLGDSESMIDGDEERGMKRERSNRDGTAADVCAGQDEIDTRSVFSHVTVSNKYVEPPIGKQLTSNFGRIRILIIITIH